MSKEVERFIASLEGGFVEVVEARDYDALLAERDRLRETLKGFPGFLCGTTTGDKWIEQKRAALQGAQP